MNTPIHGFDIGRKADGPEAKASPRAYRFLLNYPLELFLVLLIIPMVSIIFGQVIFRYIFRAPPFWTEELARYIFIWVCFIGAAYAFKKKEHITLTIIYQYLPPSLSFYYRHVINLIILLMLAVLFYNGVRSCINVYGVLSPALRINMAYVNAALPVSAITMVYYHLRLIFGK